MFWVISGGQRKVSKVSKETKKKVSASRLEDARTRMYQDLIFESAEFVFGEKGFEAATMQDIASEAGVSLKTVYASYPGKQDLYRAIMVVRGRAMFDAVARAHAEAGSPVEKLLRGTRGFVDYLFEHKEWSKIHVRSQISWASRPADEATGELWDQGQRAHEKMLEEGVAAGVFCQDDPSETALMIRALTRVQVVHAIEQGETDVDAVYERLAARLLRMICRDDVEVRKAG
jgi:AcrR family transcriptional regulator